MISYNHSDLIWPLGPVSWSNSEKQKKNSSTWHVFRMSSKFEYSRHLPIAETGLRHRGLSWILYATIWQETE